MLSVGYLLFVGYVAMYYFVIIVCMVKKQINSFVQMSLPLSVVHLNPVLHYNHTKNNYSDEDARK